tara:strand:- start:460 stop:984 length:525 start_codon:yes stop_codon:yes gene_type:complete
MSNLRLINETNITATVSTVDITDVFNNDFDIYNVQANGISTSGTTHGALHLELINASGTVLQDSNYDYAYRFFATNTSTTDQKQVNQGKFTEAIAFFTDQAPETNFANFYFYNPFNSSTYTYIKGTSGSQYSGIQRYSKYIGGYTNASSISGIRIKADETVNSGTIQTYGLRVD